MSSNNLIRVVHLSDIHLSSTNLSDLENYYIAGLCKDLQEFHKDKPIDIIIISGDLVDKGGRSLAGDPFEVFETKFINPIITQLGISKHQFLIVPGNHDIDRESIETENEYYLTGNLTSDSANSKLLEFRVDFKKDNKRVEKVKLFEKKLHEDTPNYSFSNNESTVVVGENEHKVGVTLINDSWRCSSELQPERHFFGTNQLFSGLKKLKEAGTKLNIAVFHHPLNAFNEDEKEKANDILKSQHYDIVICGHSHKYQAETLCSTSGGFLLLNGRCAFNNPYEGESKYQPGYSLLDLDIVSRSFDLKARKYISSRYEFDIDSDSLTGGNFSGHLPNNSLLLPLANNSNNQDNSLPDSYTADVGKIIQLLIGKSLYSDKYVFLRELVQNSVDACHRAVDKCISTNPKITVSINSTERYIEVIDDGDGMTKEILKNHFSIVGKSISQEYNDSTGYQNLISQFGIGFISTFIVARKLVIQTKTPEDGLISFKIDNVFSGFQYFTPTRESISGSSGTHIRVYLKTEFNPQAALDKVRTYYRNIENLTILFDGSTIQLPFNWTPPNPQGLWEDDTDRYKVKLGIFKEPVYFNASNCGFLITTHPIQITPYMFPRIIGGEINFKPKGIDLDLSRSNIIASEKSNSIRKELSISLRKLFREGLGGEDNELKAAILNCLFHYYVTYDSNIPQIEASYSDFYSKEELLDLIKRHASFGYKNRIGKLDYILSEMNKLGLSEVYIISKANRTDFEEVIITHLSNKGYLIVPNFGIPGQFHNNMSINISIEIFFRTLAPHLNLQILKIEDISSLDSFPDIKLNKSDFSTKVRDLIMRVEGSRGVNIEIGKFGAAGKQCVNNQSTYFLNCEHNSVKSLIDKIESQDESASEIYLLGLTGLSLHS